MSEGLILDIILLVVLLIGYFVGSRRGIFRALVGFVITAASIFGAIILSGPLSVPATEIVFPYIQDSVGGLLETYAKLKFSTEGLSDSITKFISKLNFSGFNLNSLSLKNVDAKSIDLSEVDISGIASKSTVSEADVASVSMKLIQPLIRVVIGVVIFLLLMVLLKFLAGLINKFIEGTPVIRGANAVLGGVFGVLETAVVLLIIVLILGKIGINARMANFTDGSFIYRLMSNFAPNLFPAVLNAVAGVIDKK